MAMFVICACTVMVMVTLLLFPVSFVNTKVQKLMLVCDLFIQRMGLQCGVVKLLRVTKLFMACMIWVHWVGGYMWQSLMKLNICIDLLSPGRACSVSVSVVKLL